MTDVRSATEAVFRQESGRIIASLIRISGSFDDRSLAAKAIGKPVKMVCTRADDMRFDCPRSASTQVLRMAWGDGGRVTAMDHHAAAGWPTQSCLPSSC